MGKSEAPLTHIGQNGSKWVPGPKMTHYGPNGSLGPHIYPYLYMNLGGSGALWPILAIGAPPGTPEIPDFDPFLTTFWSKNGSKRGAPFETTF